MQPYQQRVVDEKAQLDTSRQRLHEFISSERYWNADPAEQSRLRNQLGAMSLYSEILAERIAAFKP